jgi:hypothetical protein
MFQKVYQHRSMTVGTQPMVPSFPGRQGTSKVPERLLPSYEHRQSNARSSAGRGAVQHIMVCMILEERTFDETTEHHAQFLYDITAMQSKSRRPVLSI